MKIHGRRAPSCITRAMRIPRASRSIATATLLLVGFVSADESDHGLTILSASPDEGLTGSYTTADSTILFETARAASPKNRKRAKARKVEVSARIRYADGRLLAELSQGDAPAHWHRDGVPTTPRTAEEVNTAVSAAREAIAALRQEALDPVLAPEFAALAGLADPLSMTGVEEHDTPSLTSRATSTTATRTLRASTSAASRRTSGATAWPSMARCVRWSSSARAASGPPSARRTCATMVLARP